MNNIDILSKAEKAESYCLAVVADTWGSAPRGVGSLLAVFADGNFDGSVSGGCIEADIIQDSLQALETADPSFQRKDFGISDSDAWDVGLACGGKMQVLILPIITEMRKSLITALAKALADKKSALLAIMESDDRMALWIDGEFYGGDSDLCLNTDINAKDVMQKSKIIESAGKEILICNYPPPVRLVILGAVHIASHLAPMAAACGLDVHIIDPRPSWIQRQVITNLPATLYSEWSDDALAKIQPDSHTAFIALTHDPKLDDPAFDYLFKQNTCFYIGALGSKKTHAKRCDRLKQVGISDEAIAKIHAPIGLDIGATNPAEIAVAILAEIIQALRKS